MTDKQHNIKKSILLLLSKTKGPLTAGEILTIIPANKTTIYRSLYSLMSEGAVAELEFGDRTKRYEISSLGHHHHLICTNCKKVEEVEMEDKFETQEKDLEAKTGFKSVKHDLEFYGLCSNCQHIQV